MKLDKRLRRLVFALILVSCLSLTPSVAQASDVDIVITPFATNEVTWQVNYNISGTILASVFDVMDPATGETTTTAPFGIIGYQSWFDLGDVFGAKYDGGFDAAFYDGFHGIVSSDPNLGIAADYDGGGLDDLYLVSTDTSYLASLQGTSGSFTLSIPTGGECYNPGNYVSNDGMARLTVVPEPSGALILLSASLLVYCRRRR